MSNEPVIKWCNTCSRTFQHEWAKEEVCEAWAPDLYASAAIENGAEVLTWDEYHDRMRKKSEQETGDEQS